MKSELKIDRESLKIAMISIIAFALLANIMILSQQDKNINVNIPEDSISIPITLPEYDSGNSIINYKYYTNNVIQGSHIEVDYKSDGNSIRINDVDDVYIGQGSSMQPSIFSDNTLLCRDVFSIKDINEGDILTYDTDDGLSTHRVRGIYETKNTLSMQGDSNEVTEMINMTDVKCVVVGVLFT